MAENGVHDFGEAAFSDHPALKRHLAFESFCALATKPWRVLVIDHTLRRRAMKRGFILALSWGFSRRVRGLTDKKRVGIVFPPGIGGFIANLAVLFAGKIPVNLNFTLGPAGVESCIRKADIDCILSALSVQANLKDFPWPSEGVVDLVDELKALKKPRTLALLALAYLLPGSWLARLLGVPREGGRDEAGLLFTSGSSGDPKGVVLSHRNILGNCMQIDSSGLLQDKEVVIANLPIFHSFGFTVTLWYPILRGCTVATLPSPLAVKKVADVVDIEKATVLIGTPTFFKPYFNWAEPSQLASLRYVIAGAEKTPDGFADRWEATFGSTYLEGYGLTETSPVVSVNLPHVPDARYYPGASGEGNRRGSVGRIFPGHAARILNPDTLEPQADGEAGILALRGPNVFEAYLDEPERTAEMKQGDWLVTGDIGRIDADGFLFIEGRLSRFSKIGGEMVPHGAVEQALAEEYEVHEAERPMIAVAGRSDVQKGEALVVLSAIDLEVEEIREKLSARGFANLWIPREVIRVGEIPVLASGKLDLRAIRTLAGG